MNKDIKNRFVAIVATLTVLLSGCSVNYESNEVRDNDELISQSESDEIYTEEDVAIFKVYDSNTDLCKCYFMDARDVYNFKSTDETNLLTAYLNFDMFIPVDVIDNSKINSVSKIYYSIFEDKTSTANHIYINEINLEYEGEYYGYYRFYNIIEDDFEFVAIMTFVLDKFLNVKNKSYAYIINDDLNFNDVSERAYIVEEKLPKGEYTKEDLEMLYNVYKNSYRCTLNLKKH